MSRSECAARPRVVHVTTTDISLELLLGTQLEAFAAAGYEVIGVSAPGPYVVRRSSSAASATLPLRHATRSMAPLEDAAGAGRAGLACSVACGPTIVHTHNPKPGLYGRVAARHRRVPVVVNTVHGLYALPDDRLARSAPWSTGSSGSRRRARTPSWCRTPRTSTTLRRASACPRAS